MILVGDRGLGGAAPACSAQVGYPEYPVDIRIGYLSPFDPTFSLAIIRILQPPAAATSDVLL